MTRTEVAADFSKHYPQEFFVVRRAGAPYIEGDARRRAWRKYLRKLRRTGAITDRQRDTWQPPALRNPRLSAPPAAPKRNAAAHDDTSVSFPLVLPAGEDARLVEAMDAAGLPMGRAFRADALADENLALAIVNAAVQAMLDDSAADWQSIEFDDGTMVNDPGLAEITVRRGSVRTAGLFGPTFAFRATVSFPAGSRYFP